MNDKTSLFYPFSKEDISTYRQLFSSQHYIHFVLENLSQYYSSSDILELIDKESLQYTDLDICTLQETPRFKTSLNKETRNLRKLFLHENTTSTIENISGKVLLRDKFKLKAFKFSSTNYLLPHKVSDNDSSLTFFLLLPLKKEEESSSGEIKIYRKTAQNKELKMIDTIQPKKFELLLIDSTQPLYIEVKELLQETSLYMLKGEYYENK